MDVFSSSVFSNAVFSDSAFTSGWKPSDLGNRLSLWLDPTDSSTITESSGSVSQYNDKSSFGNNATQATGGNQPSTGVDNINGLNVVTFDSSNDNFMTVANSASLNFDSGNGFTIFMVTNFDGFDNQGSGINLLLSKGNGTLASDTYNIQTNSGNRAIFQSGNNETIVENSGTFNGSPAILRFEMDNAATESIAQRNKGTIYTNSTATVGSDNTDALTIGGGTGNSVRYADCKYGDIIICNDILTEQETNLMNAYLLSKWKIL